MKLFKVNNIKTPKPRGVLRLVFLTWLKIYGKYGLTRLQWAAFQRLEWMAGEKKGTDSRNLLSCCMTKENISWDCCWLFYSIRGSHAEGISVLQLLHWLENSFGPIGHAIYPKMQEFRSSHVWLFFACSRSWGSCFLHVINETSLAFISKGDLIQEFKSWSQDFNCWFAGWDKEVSHLAVLAKNIRFKTCQAQFSCYYWLKTNGNHCRVCAELCVSRSYQLTRS